MVGGGHVRASQGSRRIDHLFERQGAVAPRGVHLEVGARARLPRGVGVQRLPDLRVREEPAPPLVGFGDRRGRLEPRLDPFGDPGPDGTQLRERTARSFHLGSLLGPEPRRPRRSLERPAAVVLLLAGGAREQLAQIAVGQQRRTRAARRLSDPSSARGAPGTERPPPGSPRPRGRSPRDPRT
jgi:hypothetical protein